MIQTATLSPTLPVTSRSTPAQSGSVAGDFAVSFAQANAGVTADIGATIPAAAMAVSSFAPIPAAGPAATTPTRVMPLVVAMPDGAIRQDVAATGNGLPIPPAIPPAIPVAPGETPPSWPRTIMPPMPDAPLPTPDLAVAAIPLKAAASPAPFAEVAPKPHARIAPKAHAVLAPKPADTDEVPRDTDTLAGGSATDVNAPLIGYIDTPQSDRTPDVPPADPAVVPPARAQTPIQGGTIPGRPVDDRALAASGTDPISATASPPARSTLKPADVPIVAASPPSSRAAPHRDSPTAPSASPGVPAVPAPGKATIDATPVAQPAPVATAPAERLAPLAATPAAPTPAPMVAATADPVVPPAARVPGPTAVPIAAPDAPAPPPRAEAPTPGPPRWIATPATTPVALIVARADAVQPQPGTVASAGQVFGAAIQAASRPRDDGKDRIEADATPIAFGTSQDIRAADIRIAGAPPPPLDMRQERWPHAMIERIEILRDAVDASDTRIRLIPDALGAIDVSVKRDGDTVHVHFNAEQAATRTLLQDAQPRLVELAEARGLKLGQSALPGGTDDGQPGAGQQRAPAASRPPPPSPAASSVTADVADDTRIA